MNALATAPSAPVTDGTALGIQRRLTELGRIRLGEKGSNGEPKRVSKFRLTSASRALLEHAARIYGGTVRSWQGAPDEGMWELYTDTEALDVMVPPTRSAYSQYFEEWDAGGCTLRCDGRFESIAEVPCDHGDHEGMKVTTRVSVILPKLPGLGVWRMESHGWNAAATLPETLDLIGIVGRWIPAVIRLEQRSSKTRDANTKRVLTRRFVVPVIDLAGVSFGDMLAMGATSDAYENPAPALGAGPGSLALPPGPARPPSSTRVPRPPMAEEPPLEDETAPLSTPIDRAFPEESPEDAVFAPAPEPAAPDVDLATSIRAAAAASDLEGEPSAEQREQLAQVFRGMAAATTLGGIGALFPGAIVDNRAKLTAAQAAGILLVAGSLDREALKTAWAELAQPAAAA